MRLIKGKLTRYLLTLMLLFFGVGATSCFMVEPADGSSSWKNSVNSYVGESSKGASFNSFSKESTFSEEESSFDEAESFFSEESEKEGLQEETSSSVTSEEIESSDKEDSEVIPPHHHAWNEGEVGTAPTCEKAGMLIQTCEICGGTEYTEIPALEHDFSVRVVALEATCTVKEVIEMCCSHEGCWRFQSYQGEINPNNHKQEYISYVSSVKATCIQIGWTEGTRCGACQAFVEVPQELGYGDHEEKIVYGESSTCIKQGKTDGIKCALCHEVLTAQESLPLGEHKYYSGKCSVCGKLKPSDGLAFTLLDDEKSYKITGIGTCTDAKIVIPEEYEGLPVTAFGYGAFQNNQTIKEVYIPNTITEIAGSAFATCKYLEYVQIPEGVTTIGDSAFSGTYALRSITLPSTLKIIDNDAFYDSSLQAVTFPSGLEKIGAYAFKSCDYLSSVNFSNAAVCIDNQAFMGCVSLEIVDVGDNMTGIGKEAFRGCRFLTDVTIGKSVRYILDDAFYDTMLTRAYFAVTEGWYRDGEYVSFYSLSNASDAATLLLGRFYTWTRET